MGMAWSMGTVYSAGWCLSTGRMRRFFVVGLACPVTSWLERELASLEGCRLIQMRTGAHALRWGWTWVALNENTEMMGVESKGPF